MDSATGRDPIPVRVIKHLALGLAVEQENGQRGIVRIREISWSSAQTSNWRKNFPVDWKGLAVCLSSRSNPDGRLDVSKDQMLEYSLRLVEKDPWDDLPDEFDSTEVLNGVVTGVTIYGAFIELVSGLTGLLHQSQLPAWVKTSPLELFWPGDHVHVCIHSLSHEKRHIGLSLSPTSIAPQEDVTALPLVGQQRRLLPYEDGPDDLSDLLLVDIPAQNILIVEDEPEQAAATRNWLIMVRQHVQVVDSAEKALEYLEKFQPHIALVDVGLPQMNGATLARVIRDRWPQVRVISTTDWARAGDMMDTLDDLQSRGVEYLSKPFLFRELVELLAHPRVDDQNESERDGEGQSLRPVAVAVLEPALSPESGPASDFRFQFDDFRYPTKTGATLGRGRVRTGTIEKVTGKVKIQSMLQQCRRHLQFEQALLFVLDPVHRTVSIVERVGDATSVLDKKAIASLIFSPVRDVAEDGSIIEMDEIQPHDRERFNYLLELFPNLVSCIGAPVPAQLQMNYALFLLDRHARRIPKEQVIYAEAIALAIGAALEQESFKEKSVLLQRTALIGHLTRGMVHEVNNLVGPLSSKIYNLQATLRQLEQNPQQINIQEARNQLINSELVEIQKNVQKIITTSRMFGNIAARGPNRVLRVDEIVNETIHLMTDMGNRSHVKIGFSPPEHLLIIRSQVAALEQVLLNVILNATQQIAELRPDTGGWLHIRIEPPFDKDTGEFFHISIEDNGPGIHFSLWERIFEPGYTTRADGSGIGLYISRNLLESIGGHLFVQRSFILGGSTFILEIPSHPT